jgi:starvation-inducible DNA-binding protein
MVSKKTSTAKFSVLGLSLTTGHKVATILQGRLHALNDLQLTLKHAHWNVVGRDFIGVHEMLDPQIDLVRAMIDTTAERIATLGVSTHGLPDALVKERDWDDYSVGRVSTSEHLAALDLVYSGLISSHRDAIAARGELDPVTEDMLVGQSAKLNSSNGSCVLTFKGAPDRWRTPAA